MDHTRHIGIFSAEDWPVTLIGAGGIGAITAVVLAKMGVPEIMVIDDDTVEPVNLPTQFHTLNMLGQPKVTGVQQVVGMFSDDTIVDPWQGRVNAHYGELLSNPLVVSAVDSIDSRKTIWAALQESRWRWYFDARMGAENFLMYCIQHGKHSWYHNLLMHQDEGAVADEPCTAKATIYTAAFSAGNIGLALRRLAAGLDLPRVVSHDIRDYHLTVIWL